MIWSKEERPENGTSVVAVMPPKEPRVPFEFTVQRAACCKLASHVGQKGKENSGEQEDQKEEEKEGWGWKMTESHDEGHPPWLEAQSLRSRAICVAPWLSAGHGQS